jgi:hypothetical protein
MATSDINLGEKLHEYLAAARQARAQRTSHDYRRHLFLQFLQEAFGVSAREVSIEKDVQALGVRGRVDTLFRDIVFEFKRDLASERAAGRDELAKYLRSPQVPSPSFGVLTDGIVFEVYVLSDAGLEAIDDPVDLGALAEEAPEAALLWLDSFLFEHRNVAPDSQDVVRRFGAHSAVFRAASALLASMYERLAEDEGTRVKFDEWNALLSKVYGSRDVGTVRLFLRHTYLSLLVKVLTYGALLNRRARTADELVGIVDGSRFRQAGFLDLAEADFFAWVLAEPVRLEAVRLLRGFAQHLESYDLREVNEDLLKELYQELVDPETRHDLGEYYTPDWLAELTLQEAGYRGEGRLLDPACGSGTLLFVAIRQARRSGKRRTQLARYALENIMGLDVHPLAVTIAKANYALAMGADLPGYRRAVSIPVYMADALLREETRKEGEPIEIPVDVGKAGAEQKFVVPADMARSPSVLDDIVHALCLAATRGGEPHAAAANFRDYLADLGLTQTQRAFWSNNLKVMTDLVRENRDTIWGFILRNAYRPIYLSNTRFDFVVGNPPWLAYRYIQDRRYQAQVKALVFAYGLLERSDVKLFTVMDTSTLFFEFCHDRYVAPGGTIAFVMPKSVLTGAKQHQRFQRSGFNGLIDLEQVTPLFNVPACVVMRRGARRPARPIPMLELAGHLPRKNVGWAEAGALLEERRGSYSPREPAVRSPYFVSARAGASVYPRCFWFVRPTYRGGLGVTDQRLPYLETTPDIQRDAKPSWKGMRFHGEVEADFLYATVLGQDLLPFGLRKLELVVLPLLRGKGPGPPELLTRETADLRGYLHLAAWLEQVEAAWAARRKTSTDRTLCERLDYQRKLTQQTLKGCYKVLWNKSGTHLVSCVVDATRTMRAENLRVQGFVAEMVTYYYEAQDEAEAHYLCAILNAPPVNEKIKEHQTRGAWGPRDITRLPFQVLPIPKYDAASAVHRRLAAASRRCHQKVAAMASEIGAGGIGRQRMQVRQILHAELARIDELVAELLRGARRSGNPRPSPGGNLTMSLLGDEGSSSWQ